MSKGQQAMDSVTCKVLERLAENPVEHDRVYHEEVRYCWIDEDHQRVSPVHTNFGSALSWITRWPELLRQRKRWRAEVDQEIALLGSDPSSFHKNSVERGENRLAKLEDSISLTGKPPTSLQRLVIRTTAEPLASFEFTAAEATMQGAGLL